MCSNIGSVRAEGYFKSIHRAEDIDKFITQILYKGFIFHVTGQSSLLLFETNVKTDDIGCADTCIIRISATSDYSKANSQRKLKSIEIKSKTSTRRESDSQPRRICSWGGSCGFIIKLKILNNSCCIKPRHYMKTAIAGLNNSGIIRCR